MKRSHPFAGNTFNRLAERRNDVEWLREQSDAKQFYILPVWHGRVLTEIINGTPSMAHINAQMLAIKNTDDLILLGEFRGQLFFAMDMPSEIEPAIRNNTTFHDLRSISGLLHRDELGLLGYSRALIHWRNMHRYCGRCGSINNSKQAGHVMECSNVACKHQTFPRLDPAVIVLITDGERVLLGRQTRFAPQRYSTIAGFVEWAESIEEAVVREVFEETGVQIDTVEYHSSQPWPFPSSLMLGFVAHAITTVVTLHDGELEDARWFTRAEIATGVLNLPPPQSISFALIEDWYNSNASRPLRDEPLAAIDTPAQLFKPS